MSTLPRTIFSAILRSLENAPDGGTWTANVPEDWKQGRSVFGGLQAALALHAMRARLRERSIDLPLRVLQTTFVAPMTGASTRIDARVLRSGKTTAHVEARLTEGAETVAVVLGVFGAARPSEVLVMPVQPVVDSESAPEHRDPVGFQPEFLRHFTMQWRRGGPPASGRTTTDAVVDVSLLDASPTSEEHVVALADAVPPQALSMLKRLVFGSSLTWTLEMLQAQPIASLPLDGWRMDVELVAADAGYTSQSVMVWGPGGVPVAISRQCMVVFG